LNGLLNLKDLFFFQSLPRPELKDLPWAPVVPSRLSFLQADVEEEYSTLSEPRHIKSGKITIELKEFP